MRHIKLFESFESSKLNKTLSFLNKDSKSKFLKLIKRICDDRNLPESRLNDDIFEYLPYNKALKFNGSESNLLDCTKCENGKVTRVYGKGTRKVNCAVCKGTGKVEPKSELSLVKFWFDQNGNYLSMTGVDGIYRPMNVNKGDANKAFSKDLSDYEIEERVPKSRMNEVLKTGDIVKLTLIERSWSGNTDHENVLAIILKTRGKLWAVQDLHRYQYDYISSIEYDKYGRYVWQMTNGSIRSIIKLKPKDDSEVRDIMGYNTQIDDDFKVKPISISSEISNANFAIVLDLNKLKNIDAKKSDIVDTRKDSKEGAISFLNDSEIKQANINRYFEEIRRRSKLVGSIDDITNFNKIIARISGGNKYALFNLLYSSGFLISTPSNIANYILHILKTINKTSDEKLDEYLNSEDFKSEVETANGIYKEGMNNMLSWQKVHDRNIAKIDEHMKDNFEETDTYKRYLDMKVVLNKLSTSVNAYINSFKKCECLEDVTILIHELKAMKDMLHNTITRDLNPGNWSSYSYYSTYCSNVSRYNELIDNLEYSIAIVDRKAQLNRR